METHNPTLAVLIDLQVILMPPSRDVWILKSEQCIRIVERRADKRNVRLLLLEP